MEATGWLGAGPLGIHGPHADGPGGTPLGIHGLHAEATWLGGIPLGAKKSNELCSRQHQPYKPN